MLVHAFNLSLCGSIASAKLSILESRILQRGLGLLQLLAFDASSHLLTLMTPQHEAGDEAKPRTNH